MSNYHNRMMNIRIDDDKDDIVDAYKIGHKDARHVASEIAAEVDQEIAALKAERDFYVEQMKDRNRRIEKLKAEIERKDEVLNKIANTIWHKDISYDVAKELQRMAKQALSEEE